MSPWHVPPIFLPSPSSLLTSSILRVLNSSHTFFNSLLSASWSEGVRLPPPPQKCHFLGACCRCSKPFFLTHHFTYKVFFCFFFFPFSTHLPGGKMRGRDRPSGSQRGHETCAYALVIVSSLNPWLPGLILPPRPDCLLSLPSFSLSLHFYFYLTIVPLRLGDIRAGSSGKLCNGRFVCVCVCATVFFPSFTQTADGFCRIFL